MSQFNKFYLAEKPDAGKTLAEYLAKTSGQKVVMTATYAQVGDDRIGWNRGHMLEAFMPHEYDPRYKKWALSDLPIIPNEFKQKVKADKSIQTLVASIRKNLAECKTVVGFGDCDTEGQLIQDELLAFLGNRKPVLRLWAPAMNDAGLKKALAEMRPNEEYIGWFEAALARSHADFVYGINMSRACTLEAAKHGADVLLTVGRVQTPILAMIVERELAIKAFKRLDYFVPFIGMGTQPGFKATWKPHVNAQGKVEDDRVDPEHRLLDKAQADAIVAAAKAAGKAVVVHVETKPGTEAPPLPFSLGKLQAHCSRLFGLSVTQTLEVAQSLYLPAKLATYPRVDTEYLPESMHAEAPRILASLSKAQLPTAFASALMGAKPALRGKAWNNEKVTAHFAIIPTLLENPAALAGLSEIQLKVYCEIVKRYVLQFWPPAKFMATEIVLEVGSGSTAERYVVRGKRYLDEGWLKAFAIPKDEDAEDDAVATLPAVTVGQVLPIAAVGLDTKATSKPKRFTDETLIIALENIHQYMKNPEYKKRIREGAGLGTGATRPNIIEGLVERKYISRVKREFVPSDEAILFITTLPEAMTAPDMTALWQQMSDDVQSRASNYQAFMARMNPWVAGMVKSAAGFFKPGQFKSTRAPGGSQAAVTSHLCFGDIGKPGCKAPLRLIPAVKGKYSNFFGCTNDQCKKTFGEKDGKPVERQPRPVEQAGGERYECTCGKGALARRERNDKSGFFWSCTSWRTTGCKVIVGDLDGKPDFEKKAPQQATTTAGIDRTHACPCTKGFLQRRMRKDQSGYFWSCSAWRETGCNVMVGDHEGAPDHEGKGKQGGWKNGAPPRLQVRNSGHSSGYRGGRAVTPQMNGPAPRSK